MNLLTEPAFSVRHEDGRQGCLTLPHLLGVLSRGDDVVLTNCRPHQRHAVHAFLVHIAAIILHQKGEATLPMDPEWWQSSLRDAANGDGPWDLVRPLSEPAFMQPPVGDLSGWATKFTPDEIDSLNTSAHHSVKERCIAEARVEHWVYALIEAHAGSNSLNASYEGASKVSSMGRVYVGISPSYNWGARFCRDTQVLLGERARIANAKGFPLRGGHTLLWLIPFEEPLGIQDLDPFYVEVARKIRLELCQGRVLGRQMKNRRRLPNMEGNTGDIWTPLLLFKKKKDPENEDSAEGKGAAKLVWKPPALGSRSSRFLRGFTYDLMHRILFEGDIPNPAAQIQEGDGETPLLVCFGIARYQGKTLGVHYKTLPIPPHIKDALASREPEEGLVLGHLSTEYIRVATGVKAALMSALAVLRKNQKTYIISRECINKVPDDFEAAVDGVYFARLFERVPVEDWSKELWGVALDVLEAHLSTFPLPQYLRYEYRAKVKNRFYSERCKAEKAKEGNEDAAVK